MSKRAMKSTVPATKRRKLASTSGGASFGKVWDNPEISKGWTARGASYWKKQAADTEGMTGGGISRADLVFSKMAMDGITAMPPIKDSKRLTGGKSQTVRVTQTGRKPFFRMALELGAGIGRVTKGVLRHYCKQIHLVEMMKNYLAKAKKTLPRSGCRYHFHCSPAQKFRILTNHFDLIWCQWLLMYLTDKDAVGLLKNAKKGLVKGGVMVVKENIVKPGKNCFDNDKDEAWKPGSGNGPVSCARTRKHYEHLFKLAGWQIREKKLQPGVDGVAEDMGFWLLKTNK